MDVERLPRKIIAIAVAIFATASLHAQDVTLVEDFGTALAVQVKSGLGFNIEPTHEWEFQIAQKIGGQYVRFDCGWAVTEKQNPDNTSGGFKLPPACAKGLSYAKMYGQHPSMNALYGPPYRAVAMATVAADTPTGSYTIPLTLTKGSLDAIVPISSEILLTTHGQQITKKHSYSGSLIVSVDPATSQIALASATSMPLPAGTPLVINRLLYPPILLKQPDDFKTNPSIVAFGRYARFLAQSIHDAGVIGDVGLWNEPVWSGDPWDSGEQLFDKPPAPLVHTPPFRFGIPLYMAATEPIEGVIYDSGYTDKTGNGSLYTPQNLPKVASIANAQKTVAWESFHPYGNTPEDHFWYPACLRKLVANPHSGNLFNDCSAVGSNTGSNEKFAVLSSMMPEAHGGAHFNITETGLCRQCNAGTTEGQVARFTMRQFIGFEGLGVSPIMFYRLADRDQNFGWIDYETHSPLPVFTAMSALLADVSAMATGPGAACPLPAVSAYKGFYPLATVAFTSACSPAATSVLFFTWQRSYPADRKSPWVYLASPAAVPVELTLPAGMQVVAVKDAATTKPVAFTVNGARLTYAVADDPVEVSLRPKP